MPRAHDVAARRAGLAVAINAAGHLDGQHAEVGDQFAGRLEAVDVEDEGGQHGRGDFADAGDGVEVVGPRQGAVGVNQQVFQAFLPGGGVTELADLVAQQLLDGRAVQGGDGGAGVLKQGGDVGVRQVRDIGEVGGRCLGEASGGGEAVDQVEDPCRGEVLDEEGEFGEGESEQVVELVDEAGALADDGLESAGDLAQGAELGDNGMSQVGFSARANRAAARASTGSDL